MNITTIKIIWPLSLQVGRRKKNSDGLTEDKRSNFIDINQVLEVYVF